MRFARQRTGRGIELEPARKLASIGHANVVREIICGSVESVWIGEEVVGEGVGKDDIGVECEILNSSGERWWLIVGGWWVSPNLKVDVDGWGACVVAVYGGWLWLVIVKCSVTLMLMVVVLVDCWLCWFAVVVGVCWCWCMMVCCLGWAMDRLVGHDC